MSISISRLHERDGTAERDFASGLLCMPRAAPNQPPHPRADGPKPLRVPIPQPHPHNRPPAKAPFGLASGVFTVFREVLSIGFVVRFIALKLRGVRTAEMPPQSGFSSPGPSPLAFMPQRVKARGDDTPTYGRPFVV